MFGRNEDVHDRGLGVHRSVGHGSVRDPGRQPTVTVAANGSCLTSGGSVTDPTTGQTETISGDFQGHVSVTFGGDDVDCSFDEQFGSQWSQFNLPTQVGIVPAADFVAGSDLRSRPPGSQPKEPIPPCT